VRGSRRRYLEHRERVPVDAAHPASTLVADGIHGSNLYRGNILWRIRRLRDHRPARVPVQLITPGGDHLISPTYHDGAER
jgi:hypothetical protein